MQFLIDGYNLLHAAGLATARMPANRLRPARMRMLDWIADSVRGRGVTVRVIFDAQDAPSDSDETSHRGVLVRFAYRETADDFIEAFLLSQAEPVGVTVVSNDGRVQEAARRRGCRFWDCDKWMDWLATGEVPPRLPVPLEPEKPDTPAGDDAELLKAFQRR